MLDLKRNTATSFAPTNNNKFSYLVPRSLFAVFTSSITSIATSMFQNLLCAYLLFFKFSFRSEQETKSKEKDMEMERYDITKERHLLCLNKSYHSF